MTDPRLAVVLLAGGSGTRVGGERNKVLLPLDGVPVIAHSVRTVLGLPGLRRLVVVVRDADRDEVGTVLRSYLGPNDAWLVSGGSSRHASETHALDALRPDVEAGEIDLVALHDAARPLASAALWATTVEAAARAGGAVPVVGSGPLLGRIGPAPDGPLVAVQTPQAFRAVPLLAAYDAAARDGFAGTDTAACVEAYCPDLRIVAVTSERTNIKVTWPGDVEVAEGLLNA